LTLAIVNLCWFRVSDLVSGRWSFAIKARE
jgi:hypothetical protein